MGFRWSAWACSGLCLMLACLQAVWGSSIVLVDSGKRTYLRDQPQIDSLSSMAVAGSVPVLLGMAPQTFVDVAVSSELDSLLVPNPFMRPRAAFFVTVAGIDAAALDNATLRGAFGAEAPIQIHSLRHEVAARGEGEAARAASHPTQLARDMASVGRRLGKGMAADVTPLRCGKGCDWACIKGKVAKLAELIGGTFDEAAGALVFSSPSLPAALTLHYPARDHSNSEAVDSALVSELACLAASVSSQAAELKSLEASADAGEPRLLLGAVTALKPAKDVYGAASAEFGARVALVVKALAACTGAIADSNDGRLVSEFFLLGDNDGLPPSAGPTQMRRVLLAEDEEAPQTAVELVNKVTMWSVTIIVLIALLMGGYLMCYMPITRDTLLYTGAKLD